VLLEAGADRVDIVFDAAQIGVIGEQPADHRRGDAELVGVQAQGSGASHADDGGSAHREWCKYRGGDEDAQQNAHGSNYLPNKMLPTVAVLTI
jgi:hypothetical protein